MKKKINVLMCCSELSVKGGMVSVVKNYLNYNNWGEYNIIYVPTHTEKNKLVVFLYFIISYIKILKMAMFGNIEIAHLHTAERGSFYRKAILVRTLKRFGIKTIMHHHAAEFEEFYSGLNKTQKKFVNKTLEKVDLNIVLSKRLISMITDKCPTAKVEVLYNAVPVNARNPYNINAKRVLFLGRLGKRKGVYDLLDAIKLIDKNIPEEIKFYLCGDGEVEEVRERVNSLKLEHRIDHIGWIEAEQKIKFYNNSCINVLPSYHEGLPMSILETMSYGIPNVTTNVASIPEVVFDGKNGYLIEPGDVTALAEKLKDLILNDEKRSVFSNNAHELISNEFSLETHLEKLKEMYKKLVV